MQGSSESDINRESDEVLHAVRITQAFALQTTEVTQGQWVELMNYNPSPSDRCGSECPVARVTYDDIQAYIVKLNALEPEVSYRLPTEAEWEYAAKAGTQTAFYLGGCLSVETANVSGTKVPEGCEPFAASHGPKPVASYPANAWGLFDMHGNVWEMCEDWYQPYDIESVDDPLATTVGRFRVIRGGSWKFYPMFARSSNRFRNLREISGFRLVRMDNTI